MGFQGDFYTRKGVGKGKGGSDHLMVFQSAVDLLQFEVEGLPIFSDQGLLEKAENGQSQFDPLVASRIADVPLIVVQGIHLDGVQAVDADGVEVAGNRLLEVDLAVPPGLLNATKGHFPFKNGIGTFLAAPEWGFIGTFFSLPGPLGLDRLPGSLGEIRRNFGIDVLQDAAFFLFQGSAGIALYTTSPFTGTQVTGKLACKYVLTDNFVTDADHAAKLEKSGLLIRSHSARRMEILYILATFPRYVG